MTRSALLLACRASIDLPEIINYLFSWHVIYQL